MSWVAFSSALSHNMDIASDAWVVVQMIEKYGHIKLYHICIVKLCFIANHKVN